MSFVPGRPQDDNARMTTRHAKAEDAPEIVRLAGLMYASMGLTITPEWSALAATEMVRRLADADEQLVVLGVDRPDGAPGLAASGAGLVSVRLPSPGNPTGRVGYIQWIATEPEFRRRGLARAIMVALLDWFEAVRVPVVELHATDDGEPLYRSLGFGQEGGLALRRRSEDGATRCW
jgi:GNAT superfamily N-acetyltransferase